MQRTELGRNGVVLGCHRRALGYLTVIVEPALEALFVHFRQRTVGLRLFIGARSHGFAVDHEGHRVGVVGGLGRGGRGRAHSEGGIQQRHGAAAIGGAGNGKVVLPGGELTELQGLIQFPQVEPLGIDAAAAGVGRRCPGSCIGDHRFYGADVLGAGDDTAQGEGGVALGQVVDDALAGFVLLRLLGIEQADGAPGVLSGRGLHGYNSGGLALLAQTDLIGSDSGVCSLGLQVFSYHVGYDFFLNGIQCFSREKFNKRQCFRFGERWDLGFRCVFVDSFDLVQRRLKGGLLIRVRLQPHFCDVFLYEGFNGIVIFFLKVGLDDRRQPRGQKFCELFGRRANGSSAVFFVALFFDFSLDLRPLCRDLFFCRLRAGVGISDLRLADRDGQIIAGAHVAQYVAVVAAGQCPELSAVGGGVLQHQCAVNDRQTLAIRGGHGVFVGIVVGQDQLRGLLLGH